MTEHRGRFVALLVGLLVTGLAFTADPVAAASKKPSAHTIHMSGDSGALAGRGMWIWYVSRSNSGSVSSIIATARKYGINTVMIKSGDGRTMWSQFNPTVVQELHASGLHVCAWQYVYGNFPLQEANVGADCGPRRSGLPDHRC